MELWVPITIAAAFGQNLRSALQKYLRGQLSTLGATLVRFSYGVPFALLYLFLLTVVFGFEVPAPNAAFALYAAVGGIAQIVATALLLMTFSYRNFAVGTTYSKTETLQTAIFAIIVLGDPLSWPVVLAILVSFAGVVLLSAAQTRTGVGAMIKGLGEPPALIGIGSGAAFAVSAVSYRAASLSLESGDFLIRAGFTLACVIVLQTLILGVYLVVREPGQLMATIRAWRAAVWVGLSGMLASAGWFTAMTIQPVAHVRALGQIELVFTFIAAHFFFKERSTRLEVSGILLVVGGILILLLATD
ncbi:MAG: DMT family transporter [Geminicoccaceae bacterium]|nr:DMT family transporter [Geminicoccaceae bacterium]